ncbi:MAG: Zn-dependent hydrolase [Desulfobacterales bacterium]|nr:MAG: Zn-dependent hydrolase [Desulfobacterales bacterium]
MAVRIERIQNDIERINKFNATPEKGITRLTFSEQYQGAIGYVTDELKYIGAKISYCPGGNIKASLAGSDDNGPAVMMGSHLDTVMHGGRFDGVVGVVSALEAARIIVEEKIAHRRPIDIVVFAEEEGARFNWGLLGSSIWTGKLDLTRLSAIKDTDGVTYAEAMVRAGFEVSDASLLEPQKLRAMLEVHIEQGAVLEKRGYRIGLVEAIAGIQHLDITIIGRADHAGTTPMDDRSDALQAAARIITAVEEIAQKIGSNTVATIGRIACEPGQANVIPGRVKFSLDVRNPNKAILDSTVAAINQAVNDICGKRHLGFEIIPLDTAPPVSLSNEILDLMVEKTRERHVEPLRMISGAGHDSALLADVTETGMIFVPSKKGRSHCPQEFTRLEDIGLGCELLLSTVVALAASSG